MSNEKLRAALSAAVALMENLQHPHAKAGCPVCENIEHWKALAAEPPATEKQREEVMPVDRRDREQRIRDLASQSGEHRADSQATSASICPSCSSTVPQPVWNGCTDKWHGAPSARAFDARRLIDELARYRCPEDEPCIDCTKKAKADLECYAAGKREDLGTFDARAAALDGKAAAQMVRERWRGDLDRIPFGKVTEFMGSFALQVVEAAAGKREGQHGH